MSKLPLVALAVLPFALAVACGGDPEPDGSGGSGGSADGSGGKGTGGKGSGGGDNTGGANNTGGAETGGSAGEGTGGMGGDMGGMGGMGGGGVYEAIADNCETRCAALAGFTCTGFDEDSCNEACLTEDAYGYVGSYGLYYEECAVAYEAWIACEADQTDEADWTCYEGGFFLSSGACDDENDAAVECDTTYYCAENPTEPFCNP